MVIFRLIWEALKRFWDDLFILVLMNLLTVLLAVPVITFPPALAGLWYVANQIANGRSAEWSDYFWGFRHYFLRSWALALINLLVIVIVLTNIRFYAPDLSPLNISENLSAWIRGFFMVLGFLWWCYQFYPMAVLLEQEQPWIGWALRNSAILFIVNPGFTILLGILVIVWAIICMLVPPLLALVSLSLLAVVCNQIVVYLLKPFRERVKAAKEGDQNTVQDERV